MRAESDGSAVLLGMSRICAELLDPDLYERSRATDFLLREELDQEEEEDEDEDEDEEEEEEEEDNGKDDDDDDDTDDGYSE